MIISPFRPIPESTPTPATGENEDQGPRLEYIRSVVVLFLSSSALGLYTVCWDTSPTADRDHGNYQGGIAVMGEHSPAGSNFPTMSCRSETQAKGQLVVKAGQKCLMKFSLYWNVLSRALATIYIFVYILLHLLHIHTYTHIYI